MAKGPDQQLSDAEYHRLASAVLSAIEAKADQLLQEDVLDLDSSRTGGLLELSFPDRSKLVINMQPPLHELWLASKAGGFHFKHVAGRSVDTREGAEFFDVLSHQASLQAGKALRFEPTA